jgi:FkbM family methyltransferase
MLTLYSRFVHPGDLCFDIGANVGNRVKIFLKLRARVVAVEPQCGCARALADAYGWNPLLTIVQKAVGQSEGSAELMISDASTISSLSRDWIDAVRGSGRFAAYRWDRTQPVQMTTLDRLIEQFGSPSFIKIDVEGYELPVLKGLSRPVGALSFEFIPELLDPALESIRHLETLGRIRLSYSLNETMELALGDWVTAPEMIRILAGLRGDPRLFGDVYVQFL